MTKEHLPEDPVLCYVDGHTAYFTTQALEKQWGDDWNDAPYEHNAGTPYGPHKEGEHWLIEPVIFSGDFHTPDYAVMNSRYSVEDINKGAVAWLYNAANGIAIYAGTPLTKFRELVKRAGGKTYREET